MSRFFRGESPTAPSLSLNPISLLGPNPTADRAAPPTAGWESDLGLSDLLDALATDRRYRSAVRDMLLALPTDPDVIRWRQGVLADFIANPALVGVLEELLPQMAGLVEDNAMLGRRTRNLLMETSDRLAELDLYIDLLAGLHTALNNAALSAQALLTLRDDVARVIASPAYTRLQDELPGLREPLRNIGSLTIGVNLDYNLKPVSAVLMAINGREVGEPPSIIDKLFSVVGEGEAATAPKGIAPAHQFPRDKSRRYNELFQDVDKLMQQTAKPVAEALRYYVKTNTGVLAGLERELAFFIAAARLTARANVPFCRPEVAPMADRQMAAAGLRNIALALQGEAVPVPSDARFDDDGRVAVLTGPNSGGKTTFLRNVGLAQVMFQAGLFIPAVSAQISPVDQILTHFPRLETREQGRLAEEAARLRGVLTEATPHSLVLLNETFSSTAFGEALYLAQDVLGALCAIGVRAIFATHLVELTEQFAAIENTVTARSRLFSLVAGIALNADGTAHPTYEITRRAPLGRSYAQEIARQHGISLEQILAARAAD